MRVDANSLLRRSPSWLSSFKPPLASDLSWTVQSLPKLELPHEDVFEVCRDVSRFVICSVRLVLMIDEVDIMCVQAAAEIEN